MVRTDLLEAIQKTELLDASQLNRAIQLATAQTLALDQAILRLGLLEQGDLLPIFAGVLQQDFVGDIDNVNVDMQALKNLSYEYCVSHNVVPVISDTSSVVLLTSQVDQAELASEVGFILDSQPVWSLATSVNIRKLLKSIDSGDQKNHQRASAEQAEQDAKHHQSQSVDGPAIRYVDRLFEDAVSVAASDIHFESLSDGLRVRFRVNGTLKAQAVDGSLNPSSVLARVKVMANLNVSERRMPQDGRIGLMLHGRSIDIRVSTIPTSHGESIACRLLDPKSLKLGWSDLGFTDDVARSIQSLVEQPHGLFLVTGPTGSGKTTTLYTALSHLNDESQKILSVEDPVEYDLDGVDQVQVNEAVGMTFAKALRAFLRHDPNIIMIGEIRDEETAEIACRSALVGRLVLSTLHTNSPNEVVTRLQDLGVPKYILDSVLLGALGQKLEPGADGKRVLTTELVAF